MTGALGIHKFFCFGTYSNLYIEHMEGGQVFHKTRIQECVFLGKEGDLLSGRSSTATYYDMNRNLNLTTHGLDHCSC